MKVPDIITDRAFGDVKCGRERHEGEHRALGAE
jgi:hypothetical protein